MEKRETTKEVAELFKAFDDCYNLILKNKNTDHCQYMLDNDGIWKKLQLRWILEYFEYNECYEKCAIIKKHMDCDFIASDDVQNKLNISLCQK